MQDDTAKFSLRRDLPMAICLFLPVIAYPTLLIIAKDFPGFPQFGVLRFIDAPGLSRFRFESWALAFGFISIFFLGYTVLFAKAARLLFLGLASVLSMIIFVFIALVFDRTSIFPSLAPPNEVCSLESFGCFPVFLYGGFMGFSIVLAVRISERLIHNLFHQNVFGRTPLSFPPKDIFFLLYLLIPIPAYQMFIVAVDKFLHSGRYHRSEFYDTNYLPYFSYQNLAATAVFLAAYFAIFVLLFISIQKIRVFSVATILAFALFGAAAYLASRLDLLLGIKKACSAIACLSLAHRGILLGLCVACSISVIAQLYRRRGLNILYR